MTLLRDVGLAMRLPRGGRRLLGRALIELAVARFRLGGDHSRHLRCSSDTPPAPMLTREQALIVDQVAFAIPRVADRLPWRADCLVQALAGERWLRRRGIAAQLFIGVRADGPAPLDAHAWLKAGDRIVTGGDITAFSPLNR